ncbi:cytochrome c [Bdellovibrionota bacterium FG-1]
MKNLAILVWVTAGFLTQACGSREFKVPVDPTFSSILQNTIQPKCLQCHTSLATYAGTLDIVRKGNPEASQFYREVSSGSMPARSPKLSDVEIQAIHDWIQAGALEN